jgi:hypothetical protein
MGYYSRVSGSIRINPPLTWAECKATGLLVEANKNVDSDVRLEIETETRDTEDGVVTTHRGVALIPAWEDEAKYYRLDDSLSRAVALAGGNHTFTGHLVREGEEQGDVERYSIVDGQVVTEKARMTWADGTAAP